MTTTTPPATPPGSAPGPTASHTPGHTITAVTVQFSHPEDDDETAHALREEGLTPLMVNEMYVAATSEDHLQHALDTVKQRLAGDTPEDTTAYRRNLVEALATAMESGADDDLDAIPEDAVLLLAEGLVMNGYDDADQLPFCAVQFPRANVDAPVFELRPDDG